MEQMTREEAWALDDEITNADIKLGPNGTGYLSQYEARLFGCDDLTMNYLITKAEAAGTTPARIIGDMVREKIAASA
ncbi:MAG: hypothetical protein Ta2G_21100 [Termitinemataceae bacterium]|nr:MAG: hypothetical protein Ta2G_21100 [Termitinemataceae bacterium]